MTPRNSHQSLPWPPLLLAAIHAIFFVLTLFFEKTASGGNPFICVDLPWSIALFAEGTAPEFRSLESWPRLGGFIGYVGWSSRWGRMSRAGSIVGALFLPLICALTLT
jgi:hypothetical protein